MEIVCDKVEKEWLEIIKIYHKKLLIPQYMNLNHFVKARVYKKNKILCQTININVVYISFRI